MRESGALTGLGADEEVVPASEMKAARAKIRELQRLLGKKTEEVEILREGVEYAQSRKWVPQQPWWFSPLLKPDHLGRQNGGDHGDLRVRRHGRHLAAHMALAQGPAKLVRR